MTGVQTCGLPILKDTIDYYDNMVAISEFEVIDENKKQKKKEMLRTWKGRRSKIQMERLGVCRTMKRSVVVICISFRLDGE